MVADVLDEVEVVLDDHHRAELLHRQQQLTGRAALLRAHARRRLVEEQELRPAHERHADLEPLLHAVAELAREVVRPVREAEAGKRVLHVAVQPALGAGADERPHRVLGLRCEQQVVVHRELRQHGGDLELEAEPEPRTVRGHHAGNLPLPEADAALLREVGPRNRLQERALARAVGSDQTMKGAGPDRDVDPVERPEGPERLADALHLKQGGHGRPPAPPAGRRRGRRCRSARAGRRSAPAIRRAGTSPRRAG